MTFRNKCFFIALFLLSVGASSKEMAKKTSLYHYSGRVDTIENKGVLLIGTAASVSFDFTGNQCSISLQSVDYSEHHNYVSLVLDGNYIGKLKIEKGAAQSFQVAITSKKKTHSLTIYKNTEATSGNVLFAGTTVKITPSKTKKKSKKKIEFIGDSITCGAASDASEMPCDKGEYMDHHNSYYAYGPLLSRTIGADYLMSCVSGIGIYRNWNDENGEQPIMPDVYGNLYLTADASKPKYDFTFRPDIISIALGTNDFSNGDGKKARSPFSPDKFVANYIDFIKMLYSHNPKAQIVITNSPMVRGNNAVVFESCLNKIKEAFATDKDHKSILIFRYKPMTPNGCGGHPDVSDQKIMADEYGQFLIKI